jgi:hypothetical protein
MNEIQVQGNLALAPVVPVIPEISEAKIMVLSNDADGLLRAAKEQKAIATQEQFVAVNAEVVRIKSVRKQVEELFADSKEQAHKAHKAICAAEKKLLDPLALAEAQYNPMIINYTREQERKRKEEEARIQKEAEEAAKTERQRLIAEAQAAMDNGADDNQGEELIAQAETVVPVPIYRPAAPIPKPIGLTIADNWTYEVVDINLVPRAYLMVDETKLSKQAKATKDTVPVPGIRFYNAGSVRKGR